MGTVKVMKSKVKRDGEFIPPDGGWGWVIVMAVGLSNLSTAPMIQQLGLIFRDKFKDMGITGSQTSTIINVNCALTSCIGLANGPMFRAFTYRQVSFAGAIIVFLSLLVFVFSNNFVAYLISYSVLYGIGFGICSSANALVLNTYWKKRRKLAVGLSCTLTGIGPIVGPLITTVLLPFYAEFGTSLIICGFSLHAVACALLLQPVDWHSKSTKTDDKDAEQLMKCEDNLDLNAKAEPINPGYEIADPNVPLIVQSNPSYRSESRQSRSSISRDGGGRNSHSRKPSSNSMGNWSSTLYLKDSKSNSTANVEVLSQEREAFRPTRQTSIVLKTQTSISDTEDFPALEALKNFDAEDKKILQKINPVTVSADSAEHLAAKNKSTYKNDKDYYKEKDSNLNTESKVLDEASLKLSQYLKENNGMKQDEKLKCSINHSNDDEDVFQEEYELKQEKLTFWQKIVIFFDLDLLKDFTFINLMLGITLSYFNEANFSIMTPFILGDYGMSKDQMALFMSLLASVDISVRFCVPFITAKINWDYDTFYLLGVLIMTMGRVVLAHCQDYAVVLLVAVIIGFGKGLRTVFLALVIPSYVPLHKLPGATGLQLMSAGITYLAFGPLVGYIKDNTSRAVTLYSLNIFTWLTALSWCLEKYFRRKQKMLNKNVKT